MQKISIISLFLFASALSSKAQTITWADNISHILYAHCTSCHHTGGIGTFPLMTYTDATVSYIDMSEAVTSGEMPPWKADPNYRHFKDENVLSQSEINDINNWVANGKPQGNPANAPTAPVYTNGSQLSQVDNTVQIPNFTVTATVDQYRSFVIPSGYTADTYLNQIEYLPGNPAIVHHIVFYYDPTAYSAGLDQLDPGPGFESYGVGPLSSNSIWIGAWAPGQSTTILPQNMGIRIPPNADFVIEVHYSPNSNGMTDNTSINMSYTSTGGIIREVYTEPILDYQNDITDGPLFIPANTVKTFHQQDNSPGNDISLIGVFPHMHRVGISYKIHSDKNGDSIPIVDIPHWDFHWQGYYTVQSLVKIPANSTFYGVATYDNTTDNHDNPSTPPQDVSAGEHTTDEMMVAFFTYTNYLAGDENIILDSTLLSTGILQPNITVLPLHISPNPTQDRLTFSFTLEKNSDIFYTITDVLGKTILEEKAEQTAAGTITRTVEVKQLPAGIYFLRVQSASGYGVKRFVKE